MWWKCQKCEFFYFIYFYSIAEASFQSNGITNVVKFEYIKLSVVNLQVWHFAFRFLLKPPPLFSPAFSWPLICFELTGQTCLCLHVLSRSASSLIKGCLNYKAKGWDHIHVYAWIALQGTLTVICWRLLLERNGCDLWATQRHCRQLVICDVSSGLSVLPWSSSLSHTGNTVWSMWGDVQLIKRKEWHVFISLKRKQVEDDWKHTELSTILDFFLNLFFFF